MNLLIGTFTGFILILIFLFFEKRRFRLFDTTHMLFFASVLFYAYLLKPMEHFWLWVGLSILLYTVLDDMTTKSLNIYLPLLTSVVFVFLIEKPYFFIYSFVPFLILIFLTKISKERVMGEGDAYVFLPLSVLLLSRLESPSLLLMADSWIEALLISSLLAAIFITPYKWVKEDIDDIAFAPFLIFGFLVSFSEWTFNGWLLFTLFALTFLFLVISGFVRLRKRFSHRKKDT